MAAELIQMMVKYGFGAEQITNIFRFWYDAYTDKELICRCTNGVRDDPTYYAR
jgi:hypothetical protein